AGLGAFDIVIGRLDEFEQDVLDVLADVTGLGQRSGVGDGERNVEHLGQRLGQVGLATAGGPEHQDVGLGQLNRLMPGVAALLAGLDPLVVVVDGHRQRPLGGVLANDVALQEFAYLDRLGQLVEFHIVSVGKFLFDDLVAQVDALIADVHTGARNEFLDLFLALPAERALQQVTAVSDARHDASGPTFYLVPCRLFVLPCRVYSPTLPASSCSPRPLGTNRVFGIRGVLTPVDLNETYSPMASAACR